MNKLELALASQTRTRIKDQDCTRIKDQDRPQTRTWIKYQDRPHTDTRAQLLGRAPLAPHAHQHRHAPFRVEDFGFRVLATPRATPLGFRGSDHTSGHTHQHHQALGPHELGRPPRVFLPHSCRPHARPRGTSGTGRTWGSRTCGSRTWGIHRHSPCIGGIDRPS